MDKLHIDRRFPKTDREYYAKKAKEKQQTLQEYRQQFFSTPLPEKKYFIYSIPVEKEVYDFVISECKKQECSKLQFLLSAILVYKKLAEEKVK